MFVDYRKKGEGMLPVRWMSPEVRTFVALINNPSDLTR